jgi:carbon-monoxide dehydrogenase medium subunit
MIDQLWAARRAQMMTGVTAAPFDYVRPASVEEAIAHLGEHGESAAVIAGGQSLLPRMHLRVDRPAVVVDIAACGLSGIRCRDHDAGFDIGATTTQSSVLASTELALRAPMLVEGVRHIATGAVRNRGTIGGSAAFADPAAEVPALMLAAEAEVVAVGPLGTRRIPAEEFFLGPHRTALACDELLTEIRFPPTPNHAWAFREVSRRPGDRAVAGVVCSVAIDGSGAVRDARVVVFGPSDRATRAAEAEMCLDGHGLSDVGARRRAAEAAIAVFPVGTDAAARLQRRVLPALVERVMRDLAQPRRSV